MAKIINLSEDKVQIVQDTTDSYIADYGFQEKGFDSNFSVKVETENPIERLSAVGSCGCVTVKKNMLDNNTFQLDIHYDSKLLGRILKTVKVSTGSEKFTLKLRGTIRN